MSQPAKEDVSGWCMLCFGRLNVMPPRDKPRACNDTDDTSGSDDSEETDTSSSCHLSCRGGTPPLLSVVSHMDQVQSFVCVFMYPSLDGY